MKLGQNGLDSKFKDGQVYILPNLHHGVHFFKHGCVFVENCILQVEEIHLTLLSKRTEPLETISIVHARTTASFTGLAELLSSIREHRLEVAVWTHLGLR